MQGPGGGLALRRAPMAAAAQSRVHPRRPAAGALRMQVDGRVVVCVWVSLSLSLSLCVCVCVCARAMFAYITQAQHAHMLHAPMYGSLYAPHPEMKRNAHVPRARL